MVESVAPFLWNGIVVGSLLAVAALGLTLMFGLLDFINIAYGHYMAVGAYAALAANTQFNQPFLVAAVFGIVVTVAVAGLLDVVVFRPFRNRPPETTMIVSIGILFIIESTLLIIWGSQTRLYDVETDAIGSIAGIRLLWSELAVLVVSGLILGLMWMVLRRTMLGIGMRATSNNPDLAQSRGIDTNRLVLIVIVLSGAIAGAAGVFLGLIVQVRPGMGFLLLIPIFAAVVIGGIGDPFGAVVGGYVIGIIQELSVIVIPANYKPAIGLLFLIAVLIVKPTGIFGESTR